MFISYLYIGLDRAILFVEQEKVEPPVRDYLLNLRVEIRDYNGIWSFLRMREWGDGKVRTSLSFHKIILIVLSSLAGDHRPADIICHFAYVDTLSLLPRSFDH